MLKNIFIQQMKGGANLIIKKRQYVDDIICDAYTLEFEINQVYIFYTTKSNKMSIPSLIKCILKIDNYS